MEIIEITGMEFYAYHGHYEEEQIVGNRFLVDLRLKTNCAKAAKSDDIAEALNYQTAYKIVKKEMQENSHLLEHIAQRILDALYEKFEELQEAAVKVSKMNPPMGGQIQSVSVTLTR
ncbi:MAG: dihydroneopterin aldolase [Bacteroidia bacterium]|nr:MAG: dihydroneopterin aldolase [Bacteroidia bacterium]